MAGGSILCKWPLSGLVARFIHFRASSQSSMHRCHCQNTMGSPMYPPGTKHFNPNSPLFKSEQRTSLTLLDFLTSSSLKGTSIILSNLGVSIMGCFLFYMGQDFFLWYYLIPYVVSCVTFQVAFVRIL